MKRRTEQANGEPTQQYNADAELARSFAIGCGVLVVVFFCGWAMIAFFWLSR